MMLPVQDTRSLPLLYHLNSEPLLNADAHAESYNIVYKRMGTVASATALPRVDALDGLGALLRQRTSCRSYSGRSLALSTTAEILAGAYGPTRIVRFPNGLEIDARAAPSAGGLYPLELYVLCRRIEALPDGLYHYSILEHTLEPLRRDLSPDSLSEFLLAQPFVEKANALIFLAAVFDRTLHKYGARGYRYVLLEAGHVAQNLCLLATERSLGSLCIGGFLDNQTNRFLGLDGTTEAVVYAVGVGHPD